MYVNQYIEKITLLRAIVYVNSSCIALINFYFKMFSKAKQATDDTSASI